jgi:hypothetical protein
LRAHSAGMSNDAQVSPVPMPAPICRGDVVCGDEAASTPGTCTDDGDAGEVRLDSLDSDADVKSVCPGTVGIALVKPTPAPAPAPPLVVLTRAPIPAPVLLGVGKADGTRLD